KRRCTTWVRYYATGRPPRKSDIFQASHAANCDCMAVTEPTTGTDTTKTKTRATKKGHRYVVDGQKVFIGRIQHSDLMILLARTTPLEQVEHHSDLYRRFAPSPRSRHGSQADREYGRC